MCFRVLELVYFNNLHNKRTGKDLNNHMNAVLQKKLMTHWPAFLLSSSMIKANVGKGAYQQWTSEEWDNRITSLSNFSVFYCFFVSLSHITSQKISVLWTYKWLIYPWKIKFVNCSFCAYSTSSSLWQIANIIFCTDTHLEK